MNFYCTDKNYPACQFIICLSCCELLRYTFSFCFDFVIICYPCSEQSHHMTHDNDGDRGRTELCDIYYYIVYKLRCITHMDTHTHTFEHRPSFARVNVLGNLLTRINSHLPILGRLEVTNTWNLANEHIEKNGLRMWVWLGEHFISFFIGAPRREKTMFFFNWNIVFSVRTSLGKKRFWSVKFSEMTIFLKKNDIYKMTAIAFTGQSYGLADAILTKIKKKLTCSSRKILAFPMMHSVFYSHLVVCFLVYFL